MLVDVQKQHLFCVNSPHRTKKPAKQESTKNSEKIILNFVTEATGHARYNIPLKNRKKQCHSACQEDSFLNTTQRPTCKQLTSETYGHGDCDNSTQYALNNTSTRSALGTCTMQSGPISVQKLYK